MLASQCRPSARQTACKGGCILIRLSNLRQHAGLAMVLVVFFVATGLFNVLHPLWEAPDEAQHYEYIRYLAEYRALPDPVQFSEAGASELHQVPLYYVLQALLVGWVDDEAESIWHNNPYVTWPDHPARNAIALHRLEEDAPWRGYVLGAHLARLVSSLLGAGTVVVTYLIALRLLRRRALATAAAAFVAFTPGFAFSSATVNNDNGIVLLSSLVILYSLGVAERDAPRWRDGLVGGLLLAAAALTKLSGLTLVAVVGFAWFLGLRRWGRPRLRARLAAFTPLPLAFAVLAGWWPLVKWEHLDLIMRNSGLGGDGSLLAPRLDRIPTHLGPDVLGRFFSTYWGAFGWVDELALPPWQNWALGLLCAASLAGLAAFVARRGWRAGGANRGRGFLLLAFVVALSLYVFVARWLNLPLAGVERGRFLYPAIAAIAVLLVTGLAELLRARWLLGATTAGLACLMLSVPFTISLTAFPEPVPAWGILDEALVQTRLDARYAGGLTALGATAEDWELRPGQNVTFTFYWRTEVDREENFWAAFRLVGPDGTVVASDHAIPQYEAFAPRLWQAGEVVPDQRVLALPADAVPGAYRLEVRVLNARANAGLPFATRPAGTGDDGWVEVAGPRLRPQAGEPPVLAGTDVVTFGENLHLLGSRLPAEPAIAGQDACVDLLWRADAVPQTDYHVSVQLLAADGRLLAQHDGLPYDGRYPPTRWEVGETVPDRHCLSLAGVPEGEYQLQVVVYSPEDGKRLPVAGQSGDAYPLGRLAVHGQ